MPFPGLQNQFSEITFVVGHSSKNNVYITTAQGQTLAG